MSLTVFVSGLLTLSGASETSKHFVKTWGGEYHDEFNSVKQTADGGYIAAGWSMSGDENPKPPHKGDFDAILVKYDSNGAINWARYFGGSGQDVFKSVRQTTDGGYIAAGYSGSEDGDLKGLNKGYYDAVLVKFDSSGHLKWVRNFGGGDLDGFKCVRQTADGGYIAAGSSNSKDGDLKGLNKGFYYAVLVKFDADGQLKWVKDIGGSKYDEFESVRQTADGGYMAAGGGKSADGDLKGISKGGTDAILAKFDADGNIKWLRDIGGSGSDKFFAVQQTADGYIAAGRSNSNNGDMGGAQKDLCDAILAKFDADGSLKWVKTLGGSGFDNFFAVQQVSGGYMAAGVSNSKDGDLKGINKGATDAILARFDVNGNIKWVRSTGGSNIDRFYAMQQTADGGYIAAGASDSNDGDLNGPSRIFFDALLVKLPANAAASPASAVSSAASASSVAASSHTITSVTVSPNHGYILMKPGEEKQFSAVVTGSGSPSQKVTWSVTGNKSSNTKISASGKLTVGTDETQQKMVVTATSVSDPTVSGFAKIGLVSVKSKSAD